MYRTITSLALITLASAASDLCMQMCTDLGSQTACAGSGKGSYCKHWQHEPVCQGFIRRKDNSLCFRTGGPDDVKCVGSPVPCPESPSTRSPGSSSTTELAVTTPSITTTITSTRTTTTRRPTWEGKFCGTALGQSLQVSLESGRLTLSLPALHIKGLCDYHVNGNGVILSNFDKVLAGLMKTAGIKEFHVTMEGPNQMHLKAGVLLDVTLKRC